MDQNKPTPQPSLKDLVNQVPATPATPPVTPVPVPPIEEVGGTPPELNVEPPVVVEPEVKERKKPGPKPKETPPVATELEGQSLEAVLNTPVSTESVEDGDFWADVSKLTGEEIEVDFNGVDPISPEGALVYAKAYRDKGIEMFEQNLADTYPLEYQALVMRMEGKDPSVLYSKGGLDFSTLQVKEDDEETQKEILRQEMSSQGLSDKRIQMMIKSIYDSGDLYSEAVDSLKRLKQSQEERFEKERLETENQKKQVQQEIDSFGGMVNDMLTKGQLGDFVVPDKDKAGFHKFLSETLQYVDGKFVAVIPLDKDITKLNKQLQTEFFRYKNGNLKDLIVKQAITENSKKLRRTIAEATKPSEGVTKPIDDKPTWNQALHRQLGV